MSRTATPPSSRALPVSAFGNLPFLSGTSVQSQLSSGNFTAEELVREVLRRISESSDTGFTKTEAERALRQAKASDERRRKGALRGPLDGIPMAHKDMFQRAGSTSGVGTALFVDEGPARADASILTALDQAGAVDLGVVHMAELALSPFGLNAHLGNGINPWDARYPSGGSSSGSAIAVAKGLVVASVGSDTGGSIRLPAAACGVSAFKPTNGRLSLNGAFQLSATLDVPGVIGASIRDCADVFQALEPHLRPSGDESFVVAVPDLSQAQDLAPAILDNFFSTLSALVAAEIAVRMVPLPDLQEENRFATTILAYEAYNRLGTRITERPGSVGEQVRDRILQGASITAGDYEAVMLEQPSRTAGFLERHLGEADVLLLPTLGFALPRFDELPSVPGTADAEHFNKFSYWTRPINYFGLPAAQLPTGLAGGMPTGIQLVGRRDQDHKVLSIAMRIQERIPEWQAFSIPQRLVSSHS